MMTLFSRGDDPRSHRVRIVAAAKGLEIRIIDVDPSRPPEDLIDLNPYQSVPTLVDRELVVYEAGIICEYLDERFPAPSLSPVDPAGRAQSRVALHRIELDWYALIPGLESADRRDQHRSRKLLQESIVASEPLFRIKPWFLSEHFSQLDAAIAPILWRLPRWGVDLPVAGQSVERYARRVFAHPAFGASLSEAERGMRA